LGKGDLSLFKGRDHPSPRGDNSERVKMHGHFLKNFVLQNQQAKFNQTWYKLSLGEWYSNCSNKGPGPLQRGDNHKNVKMGWGHLKTFFFRTIGPILTRLGTNYLWVKVIQICSKEGGSPFPRGDNSERVNIH
jgi:hypothetical protein